MKVLVINCGSSSLKFQLIDMQTEKTLVSGICDRIGLEGSVLNYKKDGVKTEKKRRSPIILKPSLWCLTRSRIRK